jgi:hypothetical protein
MAEEGIRASAAALPRCWADPRDLAARSDALYGAWLCGTVLGAITMGLHHKLCHTLGGSFNLPHAEVHTVVLPHALAYNAPAAPQAMARITRALGADRGPATRPRAAGAGPRATARPPRWRAGPAGRRPGPRRRPRRADALPQPAAAGARGAARAAAAGLRRRAMIDKIVATPAEALADVPDGATVMIGGFGTAGLPNELTDALIAQGAQGT